MSEITNCQANKKKQSLRFGVLLESENIKKWEYSCIDKILGLDNVDIALIIINNSYKIKPRSIFKKIRIRYTLFHIFLRLFVHPESIEKIKISDVLSGVPVKNFENTKEDIKEIQNLRLDFILSFESKNSNIEILEIPKYGVWAFHSGDVNKKFSSPPFFWEIYHNENTTTFALVKLIKKQGQYIILKKGFFKSEEFSYNKNLNNVYFESARWPSQVCIDIFNEKDDYINNDTSKVKLNSSYTPTNFQMLGFFYKITRNWLLYEFKRVFKFNTWNIGIVHKPIQEFLKDEKPEIHFLSAPKRGQFRADPFGTYKNGKATILFEKFYHNTNKGQIYCTEFPGEANEKPIETFKLPYHMAYPYIFEYKEDIYCIPQIRDLNKVVLFKAMHFPDHWEEIYTLVRNIKASDSTVFQYNDTWWLTFTDKETNADMNLCIWYADELFGTWKPHANNPVKMDIRSSRPAGTPFLYNDELFRPAQDCSEGYGKRITINKVVKLTPTQFVEEFIKSIKPFPNTPYSEGIHTISSCGEWTLIDCRVSGVNTVILKRRLIKKLKNSFKRKN